MYKRQIQKQVLRYESQSYLHFTPAQEINAFYDYYYIIIVVRAVLRVAIFISVELIDTIESKTDTTFTIISNTQFIQQPTTYCKR